jgi:hypothetical protein
VATTSLWTEEHAISQATHGYPTKSWDREKEEYYADDVYRPFVKPGELVDVGHSVTHGFWPRLK